MMPSEEELNELRAWRIDVTSALQHPGGAHYVDVPKHIRSLRVSYEHLADAVAGPYRTTPEDRDEWELGALVKAARDARMELQNIHEAISKVLQGFDDGVFVRDTSGDASSSWAVRALQPILGLAQLKDFHHWQDGRPQTADVQA